MCLFYQVENDGIRDLEDENWGGEELVDERGKLAGGKVAVAVAVAGRCGISYNKLNYLTFLTC